MLKLAKYIEHEFDRNVIFFSQAYSRVEASLDFIYYIIEDVNTRKYTYMAGMNINGEVAVTDNIAFTASTGFKLQGYENHVPKEYMDESAYVENDNGFGSWQYPGN